MRSPITPPNSGSRSAATPAGAGSQTQPHSARLLAPVRSCAARAATRPVSERQQPQAKQEQAKKQRNSNDWTGRGKGRMSCGPSLLQGLTRSPGSQHRSPAFRPGGMPRQPPECRRCPIVCSHVPVQAAPHARQEAVLRDHCGHARYVWNLAVEQHSHGTRVGWARRATWSSADSPRPGRAPVAGGGPDGSAAGAGTSPRRWPRSSTRRTRPGGRRGARPGGMRDSGSWGAAGSGMCPRIPYGRPGLGAQSRMVRFRWSRAVPPGAKSYRVTMDRAGRWHVRRAIPAPRSRAGRSDGGHRPGRGGLRGPVHRRVATLPP